MRGAIKKAKRVVIKFGTSTVSHKNTGTINIGRLDTLIRQITDLLGEGKEVILVSSGAIGLGRNKLGIRKRPSTIPEKQAFAAIGQGLLMHMYQKIFSEYGLTSAQILLTRDDTSDRERYLNARETIDALINLGVIPIINENDSVAVDDINFGDNDLLSAQVALLSNADALIMLTDTEGLFTADPNIDKSAAIIETVTCIDDSILCLGGDSLSGFGTGGMASKIAAASIATNSGLPALIASGSEKNILEKIFSGDNVGTFFKAKGTKLENRKRWIAFGHKVCGKITVDAGAEKALIAGGKSILPSGILSVNGEFPRGATIEVYNQLQSLLGRGLTNYSAIDIEKSRGQHSSKILEIIGYHYADEIIHRDNFVFLLQGGEIFE